MYKELNESSAVQKSQGEQNHDLQIFLRIKFRYTLTLHVDSSLDL